MTTQTIIQTSFAGGQIGRRLRGRLDLAQYAAAAEQLTNVRLLPQGGATRRPGSYFVVETKISGQVRLVPFRVSSEVAYVLEFGASYVRFIRNRGQIIAASTDPLELATPYAVADLRALKFAQSADVLYIFHPDHQPRKISRTAADEFGISAVDFVNGPYDAENTGNVPVAAASPTVTDPEDTVTDGGATGSGTGSGADPTGGGDGGEGGTETSEAGGGEAAEAEAEPGGGVGEG